MFICLSFTEHPKTASCVVVCSGLVFLLVLPTAASHLFQKMRSARDNLAVGEASTRHLNNKPKLSPSYAILPLSFEVNRGQAHASVRFLARGSGFAVFLTDDEAVLALHKASERGASLPPLRIRPFGTLLDGDRTPPGRRSAQPSLFAPSQLWLPSALPAPEVRGERTRLEGSRLVRMRLIGASARVAVSGVDELPGRSNYFIGNNPQKWHTNVANYAKVKYTNVYSGIDLLYYGNKAGQFEYDFRVAPGADASQIQLSFAGADRVRVDASTGDLVLELDGNEIRIHKPAVYQPIVTTVAGGWGSEGAIPRPDGAFILTGNLVTFRVAGYDHNRPLVIDPVLNYSTYLGGSCSDQAAGIAVDSTGSAYVTGYTCSEDFPTANALQATNNGGYDAFVTKLNPQGSALVYSTFLGGSNTEEASGIAIDSTGNAYLTGYTSSTDFPTVNPLQDTNKAAVADVGGTVYLAKLNASGSALVYSTYLGGSIDDLSEGIAVDASGNVYLTGWTNSGDFPTTADAFDVIDQADDCQPAPTVGMCATVFVSKVNAAGSALVYSTYLGGSSQTLAYGIAADSSGSACITGATTSTDFPTVDPVQANYAGTGVSASNDGDAFITKLSPTGSAFVYSTYLGGSSQDWAYGIAVDIYT